jgi:adenine-specific DNA-methyltransferase
MVDNKKNLGQVFTPFCIVNKMLDMIEYNNSNILKKYVLEPSCGNGNILCEIVARYIDVALKNRMKNHEIINDLEEYIYAFEIDEKLIDEIKENLDFTVLTKLGHTEFRVVWRIFHLDTIETYMQGWFTQKFDYIVGNPPYVRTHNIIKEDRKIYNKHFNFSGGALNMYILFFEIGINWLKEGTGKLIYITPNSYLVNSSTCYNKFRKHISENNLVNEIVNYNSTKVFENADTYTAITYLNNNTSENYLLYKEYVDYGEYKIVENYRLNKINKQTNSDISTIGKYYNIQYGFATEMVLI